MLSEGWANCFEGPERDGTYANARECWVGMEISTQEHEGPPTFALRSGQSSGLVFIWEHRAQVVSHVSCRCVAHFCGGHRGNSTLELPSYGRIWVHLYGQGSAGMQTVNSH
eukprot:9482735-Pyramimonas_sp.AAC.1